MVTTGYKEESMKKNRGYSYDLIEAENIIGKM